MNTNIEQSIKKKRIAIVAHKISNDGGTDRCVLELVTRLAKEPDVELFILANSLDIDENNNIRYFHIPMLFKPFPLRYNIFLIYASLLLKKLDVDILHTTGAIILNHSEVSTIHLCHKSYVKMTGNSRVKHNNSYIKKINAWISTKISLLFENYCIKERNTTNLIAVSNAVKNEIIANYNYSPNKIHVIPNGVESSKFNKFSTNERFRLREGLELPIKGNFILFMGGDWPLKGLDFVIEAFNKIGEKYSDLYLLVVGSGNVNKYKSKIKKQLNKKVFFMGFQKNPETYFGISDIFVFPSSYETFSLVVHEAAASGLAILSTKVGGVEDLIDDNENGLFIKRDSGDISKKLEYLLENPMLISDFGLKAREKVLNLTWERNFNSTIDLYNKILNEKSSKRKIVEVPNE
ncbi:glycosyltransferase family 4 protein [Neobacillus cucumis]|uniref:Glycosyltransferase family 1 protein n=1 Tax=Neobacillus cucumis TaxID=1740721 RepID=A0A2N5H7L7_9BACI|nr:glycosyltransferase family 4 protein [Neobacillus cucumis]PLS01511.1 hypothetical protein CVD27_24970 [Neobacillus cucumis]